MSVTPMTTRLSPTRTITVASVPASHVYIRHIASETPDGVVRLPDPDPHSPGRSTEQQWWPPVMLSKEWVQHHDFDVFHVHFGFDAFHPQDLADVVDAVHARGRTLVQTVHDLRNPHHSSRDLHDAQLEILVRGADEVVTLTAGAAEEIARRWGRTAHVLSHPHVVDFATMEAYAARERPSDQPFRVGLHVKSLRASMDPHAILPTLVDTVNDLPGAVLQVNGHKDVLLPDGARYDAPLADLLREHEREGRLEVAVHDFMSDPELWDYLGGLDVSVLPYRFGTHSGWLEACRDLGTAVIAPTCGYYADQGPVHSYRMDESGFDAASLARAVRHAYEAGPVRPVSVQDRRHHRAAVAAAHRTLYGGGVCASA
jgi:glycosyltransferase involved in cell wall biosynthesis